MFLLRRLLGEAVTGYAFWTLIHGLAPMVWFLPLNEQTVTGYEYYILAVFSPFVCLFGSGIRSHFSSRIGQGILRILMIVGLFSFQVSDTVTSLAMLSCGNSAAYLLQAATWWKKDYNERQTVFWGWTLGFFLLLSSRIWYISLTPAWTDIGSNNLIITFFTIASLDRIMSNDEETKVQSKHHPKKDEEFKSTNDSHILISVAFGSLLFLIHSLFGEVSVICRYAVSGRSTSGPEPNPWGGLILVALAFGIMASMYTGRIRTFLWNLLGVASGIGLMFLPGNLAFLSGVVLAVYTASLWPLLADRILSTENPGKSLVIANFVYIANVVGMICCTAYNFIPYGGEYTREKTYILIAFATITMAYVTLRASEFDGGVFMSLSEAKKSKRRHPGSEKKFGQLVIASLLVIVISGLVGLEVRNQRSLAFEHGKTSELTSDIDQPRTLSAMIWAIHFGYNDQGKPNLNKALEIFQKTDVDVIALLQSDASKPYLGNNDIGMWMSEKLGMYLDFGPSTRDHTWGSLILSKYPILSSTHYLLPAPNGSQAPALSVTTNVNGRVIDFITAHLGNSLDMGDRDLQAKYLANVTKATKRTTVFLGYLSDIPRSRDYFELLDRGNLTDIDESDKERCCEYIFYRDLIKLGYARISHGGMSHTEMQMARWQIPEFEDEEITDNEKLIMDDDTEIPLNVRFPKEFGEFYEGHWFGERNHYHMSTPKYFIPE